MYFYLLFIFSFYFISGKEPYHGCTDIKPLLLLLKLYLLLLKLLLLLLYSIINTEKCYLLGNHSPLWQVLGCSPIDSCLAFWSDQQLSLC